MQILNVVLSFVTLMSLEMKNRPSVCTPHAHHRTLTHYIFCSRGTFVSCIRQCVIVIKCIMLPWHLPARWPVDQADSAHTEVPSSGEKDPVLHGASELPRARDRLAERCHEMFRHHSQKRQQHDGRRSLARLHGKARVHWKNRVHNFVATSR